MPDNISPDIMLLLGQIDGKLTALTAHREEDRQALKAIDDRVSALEADHQRRSGAFSLSKILWAGASAIGGALAGHFLK